MKRDEAEKLIDSLTDAAQECECAEFLNDFKLSESASKKIDKLRAKLLAALAPELNQPEGTGYYDLTIRVGVYRDSSGYETVTYQDNGSRYLSAETKDITGHWRKVKP